ncbi:MAG: CotH kinase family protein [Desulfovibrio sp.]|jgi:hypothetical protein|nr:CotH kinase family protein [Desulfovibrio sp.]
MRKFVVVLFIVLCAICLALPSISPSDVPAFRPVSQVPTMRESIAHTARSGKEAALAPYFSPSGHFYAEAIVVSIRSRLPDVKIYYTLDGSEPTENSVPYTRPLLLEPKEGANCVVVKAVTVSDGRTGPVATHSYLLDPDISGRFKSYVFSLSTDSRNLYDHERGILVPGKLHEESEALHPDKKEDEHDANYKGRGRDWERPVYVEAFTPDGKRVVAQKAGIRVSGGRSRADPQKGLRLTAREEYERGAGKFKYQFFPEFAGGKNPSPISSYNTLILRNSGLKDDQIRSPLLTRLAAKAGYPHVSPVHSATVFLNGEYYGHAYLKTRLDDDFFAKFYDARKDNFIILEVKTHRLIPSYKYPYLSHWYIFREFDEIIRACALGNSGNSTLDAIERWVDVDNLLFYYAVECYADNADWPDHNSKIWRYYGENATSSPVLDGRWRYILFDMDDTASNPSKPTIHRIMRESPLFGALMKRRELAAKFANYLCDMAFVHFAEQNVRKEMEALNGESQHEIQFAARHGIYSPPGLPETIARGRENMLAFFRKRPEHVLRELRDLFGYTGLYHVIVNGPAKLNTIRGNSPQGWYFVENSVAVSPDLPGDKAVGHWEVNGQIREGEKLLLTADDTVNGEVRVKLVTRDSPSPLEFVTAYDNGGLCGFSLRNTTNVALSAEDFYLSDKPDKPKKWHMAGITFSPGEVVHFVGKSYRHADALLKLKVNFNPRRGETVYLRDKSGAILSSAAVR